MSRKSSSRTEIFRRCFILSDGTSGETGPNGRSHDDGWLRKLTEPDRRRAGTPFGRCLHLGADEPASAPAVSERRNPPPPLPPPAPVSIATAPPKETRLMLDGTEVHDLASTINGRSYQIIVGPPYQPEPGKKFATVYILDGYWDFPLVNAMRGSLNYD